MKLPKLQNLSKVQKIAILSSASALVLVVIGVSVFAMQPKVEPVSDSSAITTDKVEAPKEESAPAVEEVQEVAPVAPAPAQVEAEAAAPTTPEQTAVQSTAPSEPVNPDLEKNCGLVNSTIEHLRSTYAARGATPSNQDILNDLRTNPRASAAYSYYQQCVDAGKTQAL